ncbi:HAMP domain-containing protein [Kitasatospora purpeofusca]|uniref:HAMP domain-containing protein n=1 Tax=Kitasatospora purpeofusca TaxID=67352 RepID=UPI003870CA96|nr:ATP-binding protein [Kitasatospora purpeofusca]
MDEHRAPGTAAGRAGRADGPDRPDQVLRQLLAGLTAVRDGDFRTRLGSDLPGVPGEIATVFNGMVEQLARVTSEVTRVAREVGSEGRLGGQADVRDASGTWRDLTESVNVMADNLTAQVRSIASVTTAVAQGDLTQKIRVDARGEILELKETINTMVDQLSSFAGEVTRVAREVGTEGNLGGQATVRGVSGTWKDLTDNVNVMASNLTGQVRSMSDVATAVARGDLSRKITVEAKGEMAALADAINTMVDTLSVFAAEVTRVAREVGTEGRLGGQAEVEGVSGTWKRLTENVNELAGNLTRQVRAIAEVTGAVAAGDLTRSITVDASGEVADLKDNINFMVESLRETTRANQEQDWLKTNLARFTGTMQGQRDIRSVAELITDGLTPLVGAQYGAFYLAEEGPDGTVLARISAYGGPGGPGGLGGPGGTGAKTAAGGGGGAGGGPARVRLGESLVGQAARSRRTVTVDDLPPDYATIGSGSGATHVRSVLILPIALEEWLLGVMEFGSVHPFSAVHRDLLEQFAEVCGVNIGTLLANARTDELLGESQRLTAELQSRSEELQEGQQELRRSNAELGEKAALLAERNRDIEAKNLEIEQARQELEERARQLSLTSMYKSEFLANMSHELRTPLNSLLILAQLLAQNAAGNLTPKQVEYAGVIHSAGSDLLQLINDILDLSKVEAGKMEFRPEPFAVQELLAYVEAAFKPLADQRGLAFRIGVGTHVPGELVTDQARLRQVLRNLLSNAIKFTDVGQVELRIERVEADGLPAELGRAGAAVAFHVEDTGIGIDPDHLDSIFGAFQQADGTTARRFGGTGLGLSISRELARLLGGVLTVRSTTGRGSRFSFYLPLARPDRAAAGPGSGAGILVVEAEPPALLTLLARTAAEAHGEDPPVEVRGVGTEAGLRAALADGPYRCAVLDLAHAGELAPLLLTALPEGTPVLGHQGGGGPVGVTAAAIAGLELPSGLDGLRERLIALLGGRPPAGAEPGEQAVPAGEPLAGRTTLIVDDDVRNVFALAAALEQHGLTVLHAADGRAGLDLLRAHPETDLVLMDVMMPGLDGYATIAAIRADERFARIPVVVVTAKAMAGDRAKSLAAGADDHVSKPVDTALLLERMRHWLDVS